MYGRLIVLIDIFSQMSYGPVCFDALSVCGRVPSVWILFHKFVNFEESMLGGEEGGSCDIVPEKGAMCCIIPTPLQSILKCMRTHTHTHTQT